MRLCPSKIYALEKCTDELQVFGLISLNAITSCQQFPFPFMLSSYVLFSIYLIELFKFEIENSKFSLKTYVFHLLSP